MNMSPNGLKLLEEFEGLRTKAYRDVVGVWTIGIGHTGPEVHSGLVWTKEQAYEALAKRLDEEFEPAVLEGIHNSPVTQNQFDAMVSLAYNIGAYGFKNSSVARLHRTGNYIAAAQAFELWVKAGGRYLEPLHRRRIKEAQLYLTPSEAITPIVKDQADSLMKKAIAREFQITLKKFKLYEGELDGLWGPRSKAAYETFLNLS